MIKTSRSAGVIPQYRDFSCIRRRDPSYRGEKSFSRKAGAFPSQQEQPTLAFFACTKTEKTENNSLKYLTVIKYNAIIESR
jgi:hypothetical protein